MATSMFVFNLINKGYVIIHISKSVFLRDSSFVGHCVEISPWVVLSLPFILQFSMLLLSSPSGFSIFIK
jgi:hypothetical protein